MVLHLDVSREKVERAIEVFHEVLAGRPAPTAVAV
jgi:hypothetical protein